MSPPRRDRRHAAWTSAGVILALAWVGAVAGPGGVASTARADAPAIVASGRSGALAITLLAEPSPPRVGRARLLVAVQTSAEGAAVPIDRAGLRLEPPSAAGVAAIDVAALATGGVHAAAVELPIAGEWLVEVSVVAGGDRGQLRGRLRVEPALPPIAAWWPYLAAPFAFLGLYALHQVLSHRRAARRQPESTRRREGTPSSTLRPEGTPSSKLRER
jgi:hypothetical protein